MKICMIVNNYPTEEDPIKSIFLKEIVEALKSTNLDVFVYKIRGLNYFRIFKFRKFVRKNQIDIFHAQFGFPTGFWTSFVRVKKPFIVTIHRFEVINKKLRLFVKYVFKKANLIIAVSEYIKEEILKINKKSQNKIIVLPNSIDIDRYTKLPIRHLQPDKKITIGTLAIHSKRKGIDLLLRAIKIIEEKGQNVKLLIAGKGSQTEELIKLSRELELKDIEFLGRIEELEKANFYEKLDIFVLSSFSEGHPVTLLEAMCTGTCPIVSNIPSVSDTVIDNINGKLFTIGNVNSLSEVILYLIENPDKLNYFKKEARETIETNFNILNRAEKLKQLYLETIK